MNLSRTVIRQPLKPGPRKLPRGTGMSTTLYRQHKDCQTKKLLVFADGAAWCETCGKYVNLSPEGAKVRRPQGVTWTSKILK